MKTNTAIFIAVALMFSPAPASRAEAFGYREKGYQYLSPIPEAEYVSPQTRFVLVRFETISPYELTNLSTFIEVTGDASGLHPGQAKIATDDRTVIFEVSSSFLKNETVTVTLTPIVDRRTTGIVEPFQYRFFISQSLVSRPLSLMTRQTKDEGRWTKEDGRKEREPSPSASAGEAMIMENGVSVPSDLPHVNIAVNDNPAPGYIFIDYDSSIDYTMILNNTGAAVWYKRGSKGRDFKVQKNGMLTMVGGGGFVGYDQNFNRIASFYAVNGYSTDDHELQVLEDGRYLLIGRRNETVDMRQYVEGGKPNATVRETVLQEFTLEGDLILQWRAWDNYDIHLMEYWSYDDKPTSQSIRFVHMNAIDIDTDGHILVSSKRVSEVTKIHRYTGEVIWRLGGEHPDPSQDPYLEQRLTILNDPLGQFNVQHDIRVVGENRYTVFDNHHLDSSPNSRAVEYEVDPNQMTATMVWEYYGGYDSFHMGNAQRLPNGNTLINWVITSAPKATEVRPDGTKVFEMNWVQRNSKSYRVFRFPWEGMVEVPYLIVEPQEDNVTLIFNKFGDPNVAYYIIYGGTSPHPTEVLDISESTLKRLTALENGRRYYFRVTAVDFGGLESDYSNEEDVVVHIVRSNENMVLNGDFSQEKSSWTWQVGRYAAATWKIEDGVSHFDIANGGNQVSDVQLRQAGIQLVHAETYIFEFDAWADAPRIIEAKVGQDGAPYINYSRIGYIYVTPQREHLVYSFMMQDATDFNTLVVFNMGMSNADVYIDNVSLKRSMR